MNDIKVTPVEMIGRKGTTLELVERVLVEQIRKGDVVSRSKNTPFGLVTEYTPNAISAWLTVEGQGRKRPGYAVKYWRVVPD